MTRGTQALEFRVWVVGVMEFEMSGMQPHAVAVASPFTRAFRAVPNMAPLAPPPSRRFTRRCNLFPVVRIEVLALPHHDAPLSTCWRLARRANRFTSYHATCPAHSVDDHALG